MPSRLNWWVGILFAIGSSMFVLGSVLALCPGIAHALACTETEVNAAFFIGSVPFTLAAMLQWIQATRSEKTVLPNLPRRGTRSRFGAYLSSAGWLSAALQFAGTLLFNVNTFDAMLPNLDWLQQDLRIWLPDVAGSLLFLVSGYLAFIEFSHAYWSWRPSSVSWWIVMINLLGCIAFMISAVYAFIPCGIADPAYLSTSIVGTLVGAICFWWGSVLMLPETAP